LDTFIFCDCVRLRNKFIYFV